MNTDPIRRAQAESRADDVVPEWDYMETRTDKSGRERMVRMAPPDVIEQFQARFQPLLDHHYAQMTEQGHGRTNAHVLAEFAAMNALAGSRGDLGRYVRRLRAKRVAHTLTVEKAAREEREANDEARATASW